ncbi:MAG: 3-deoxy-D-manno-octulosonic acid transferase [Candidatus Gastranaerophilaceae bacterium]
MIYGILSTIAFIIILPFWLVLGLFKPKLLDGFKEKCGFYNPIEACGLGHCDESKKIVFYGVSVGEVIAMENLIKKTRETFPEINIILLTGTKTGQEIAHKKLGQTCDFISYFPFDFPFCIEGMVKTLKPDAVFVAETELWPNFANILNEKQIPLFIINARISDRTYKSYKKLKFIFAPILKKYTAIYPQSRQDMEKLVSIGANPDTTKIMGNLKFDIKKPDVSSLEVEKKSQDKILLAGSTHTGEDEIILDVFNKLKKEIPNLKLIIAPRHPERNNEVFELIKKTGFDCAKRSEQINSANDSSSSLPALQPSILLLDTMGELGKFYSICDVAFIGGSFRGKWGDNCWGKGVGGHNPLEATIFNKPVVSGPSIHNFKDIYAILASSEAGKIAKTPQELKEQLKKLLTDDGYYQKASKNCEEVFEQNKGALDFVLKVLQSIV